MISLRQNEAEPHKPELLLEPGRVLARRLSDSPRIASDIAHTARTSSRLAQPSLIVFPLPPTFRKLDTIAVVFGPQRKENHVGEAVSRPG